MSPITETELMTNILTINLPNYAQKLKLDFYLMTILHFSYPIPSLLNLTRVKYLHGIHGNPWNS